MPGKDKKYAVEGMRVKCSIGTTMCTLNTMGHGVTYQGKSVLNANDHIPMVNIMTFGTCINKPCVPVTPLAWRFCNEEHMIDGAPALTTDSLCNCALGGVISIVDNSVSMGGIGAQSVKSKSDVGNKPEIEETTHSDSMHDVHISEKINSDLKINTEIVDNDGIKVDNIAYSGKMKVSEKVKGYVENIVKVSGDIDTIKMKKLQKAIENGIFDFDEIKQISKTMSELGITKEFEATMKEIDIGKYLRSIIGDPPENMFEPHAHHILFKTGLGSRQQALVEEGQAILRKYGIDPIVGRENLVWAPNKIVGQHNEAALKDVVDTLKQIDEMGGDYEDIVEALQKLGMKASQRK